MSFGGGFVAGALTVVALGVGAAAVSQLYDDGFFDGCRLSPNIVGNSEDDDIDEYQEESA